MKTYKILIYATQAFVGVLICYAGGFMLLLSKAWYIVLTALLLLYGGIAMMITAFAQIKGRIK